MDKLFEPTDWCNWFLASGSNTILNAEVGERRFFIFNELNDDESLGEEKVLSVDPSNDFAKFMDKIIKAR